MPAHPMKRHTKIALAATAVVALTALLGAGYAHERFDRDGGYRHERGWRGDHHGKGWHHGRRSPGGRHGMRMLERFDADGDGKLTRAEVDAHVTERIEAFDADGNGQLSLEEFQGLWLEHMRERMVDGFQMLDDDGDAQVTGAEMGNPFRRLVERADLDGDGAVSRAELERKKRRHHDGDDD